MSVISPATAVVPPTDLNRVAGEVAFHTGMLETAI
jgi:hypothetical protein